MAIVTAAMLLITRAVAREEVYRETDWSVMVMLTQLFILTGGAGKTHLPVDLAAVAAHLQVGHKGVLSCFAAILSNVVRNVPAVVLLKPFAAHLPNPFQN